MDSSFARLFYVDAAGIGCMKRCLPRYSGGVPVGSITTTTFDPDHVHEAKLQIRRWHKDEWKIQFVFNPFNDLHYNHGFIVIRDQALADKHLRLRNKSTQQYNLEIWNACYVTIYEEMFSKGRVTFCLGVAQIRTLLRKLESHGRPVLTFPKTKAEKGIVDREIEAMYELETEDLAPIPQLFKENGWKFKHYGYCATLWYIGGNPAYEQSATRTRNLDVCIKYGITVKLRRLVDWEFLESLLPVQKTNSMSIIMASAKSATAQVLNNCTTSTSSTKGQGPSTSNWLPTVFDSSISAAQFPLLAPFGIAQKSRSEEILVAKEISNSPRPSPPPFMETLFLETDEEDNSQNSKSAKSPAKPNCSSANLNGSGKKVTPFEQQFTRRSSNVNLRMARSLSPNNNNEETEEDENEKSQNSAKSKRQKQSKPQAPTPPKISLRATPKYSRSRSRSRSLSRVSRRSRFQISRSRSRSLSRRKISSAVKQVSRSRSTSPRTPRRSRYQSPRSRRSRSRSISRSRRSRWDMSESPEFRTRARSTSKSSDTNKPSTSRVKPHKISLSRSPSKSQTSTTDSEERERNFERISLINLRPSERRKHEILWGKRFSLKFKNGGRDLSIRPKSVVSVYPAYAKKILYLLETHYVSAKQRNRLVNPNSIATQTESDCNEETREKKNKIPKRQDFRSSRKSSTSTSSETLSRPSSQEDNGMGNDHGQSLEEGEINDQTENSDREIFDRASAFQIQKPQPFKKVPQIMSKIEQQANQPKIRINILSNAQKEQALIQNKESTKSTISVPLETTNLENVSLLKKASSQWDEISALKIQVPISTPSPKVPENTLNISSSNIFINTSDAKRASVQNSKPSESENNQKQSNVAKNKSVEMSVPNPGKKVISLAALRKLQKLKLEENKKAEEAVKKEEE